MFTADYHMHTHLSMDGDADTHEMILAAAKAGLDEIAICDHCDLNLMEQFSYSPQECFDDYREAAKGTGMTVKVGVEMGQQTEFPDLSAKILSFNGYDFVIGSYHCMEGYPDFSEADYSRYDVRELYSVYMNGLLDYVSCADFDILGHITYPFRYGVRQGYDISLSEYAAETDKVLNVLVEREKGLEANTSGLRDSLCETMPPLWVHKRFLELGGKRITVGSDAHFPRHVGYMVRETTENLKKLGLKEIAVYTKREVDFRSI